MRGTWRSPGRRLDPRLASRPGPRLALACVVLAGAVTPAVAEAQVVTGTVLDATTSAPLTGVLVSLLDLEGVRAGGTLTDEAGRFHFDVEGFGRYTLRAERIGLEAVTTSSFDLVTTGTHVERILMGSRAVEIAGLVVDGRVQQCRNDPAEAVLIQRWWRDVRTALDVSSVVQSEGIASFRIARFEREWDDDLKRILSTSERREVSLSNRPFVSADVDFLAEGGYVQGEAGGERRYYAPDAEVLLSSTFLADHCFRIVDHDDEDDWIGLAFEPTRDRRVPGISGTLWVDSSTSELQHLDFRYTNMQDLPSNESGGYVGFEYLPSGAWMVDQWYIRMPRLGRRNQRGRTRIVLVGYIDVGGEVRPVERTTVSMAGSDEVGTIRGFVFDSIRGGGLSGALVSVLGTRFQVRSDASGNFEMPGVPVGEHDLTFFHDDPEAWGLGSSYEVVRVEAGGVTEANLALPSFRTAAGFLCLGDGADAMTVLLGRVVDADGQPFDGTRLRMTWDERAISGAETEHELEARTGSKGDFVVCSIPPEAIVSVEVEVGDRWIDAFEAQLPPSDIVFRHVMIPARR